MKIWIFSVLLKKKNAIPLVLPIEEISFQPELSSPPRFRIQGGRGPLSVTHQQTEILVSNIGYITIIALKKNIVLFHISGLETLFMFSS